MPGGPPSTQSGDRHDRVVSPPRMAKATGDGSDVVTSLGTKSLGSRAAQFSRTAPPPPRRDSPSRREPPQGRPPSISAHNSSQASRPHGPTGATSECSWGSAFSGHPNPGVAALADLEHLAVELARGHIEPIRGRHCSTDPDSPLLDQPPRLAAAHPEVVGHQSRQMDCAVGTARLDERLTDVLRHLTPHVDLIEALLRGGRRAGVVEPLDP